MRAGVRAKVLERQPLLVSESDKSQRVVPDIGYTDRMGLFLGLSGTAFSVGYELKFITFYITVS